MLSLISGKESFKADEIYLIVTVSFLSSEIHFFSFCIKPFEGFGMNSFMNSMKASSS